jgi:ATP-dependent Clp protease ATP-binding subunit ClpA
MVAATSEGRPAPDPRFAKFTQNARQALVLAQDEAVSFSNNFIGTEHLLLGLLDAPQGTAKPILTSMGVDLSRLRTAVEEAIAPSPAQATGEIGLTPRAKTAIDLAAVEARFLGHHYVGQEHLLLGLVREGEGIAWSVLSGIGVTLDRLRPQVLQILARGVREVMQSGAKNIVVTCRITEEDAQALDDLVEAGVRSTRSDAAGWLIRAGIDANTELLQTVRGTVVEIRRLREVARQLAQQVGDGGPETEVTPAALQPEDRVSEPRDEDGSGGQSTPEPPAEPSL